IPIPQTLEAFFFEGSPFFEEGAHWATHAPSEFFRYCNLNFGVMATAVENITGQRFDEYMQTAVLRPLGLTAAYNVAQLPDNEISHIAALYRKVEGGVWNPQGRWVAQADDYRGVKPRPLAQLENPDVQTDFEAKFGRPQLPQELEAYRLGTNGTLFSPQGGLRISLPDLARLMQMFLRGGEPLLRPETVRLMLSEQWRYDGSLPNGDSFSGLMRSWGLSVHRFTHSGTAGDGDKLLADRPLYLVGHLGEAYGLLSGFLFDPAAQHGLLYILNGVSADPLTYSGRYSSFSRWEEKILTILGDELLAY
ncbi:MAG: beta-lactamase family protein, partial [Anaerolineales bacterium]|nr:beta-lactamase family protein [Anaerolineales bacterium]